MDEAEDDVGKAGRDQEVFGMTTYVVVRRPVDWLNFSESDSVAFCRSVGYEDTTIIDFCQLWRRSMRGSFQEVRHRLAQIARRSWLSLPGAEIIDARDLSGVSLSDDDRIVMTDDDDWLSSDVASVPIDSVWGSLALVKVLYPPERTGDPILIHRPFSRLVYTNNSSFGAETLRRLGLERLFEHGGASNAVAAGEYDPVSIETYLSCANKHPCSATMIKLNMQAENFCLHQFIVDYLLELEVSTSSAPDWLLPLKADLVKVFRDCLPS